LQDLFNSDSYRNYLSTMSKFHNYSFNNTLLIAMQKPDATLVAGYKAWQKNFERHVNKGEKAIRILAPTPYKIKEERDKIDPVTQELLLDKDGNPQKEEVEITIPAFRAVSVFDVAQTDGKPIPELAAKELLSDVEGYQDMIRAVEAISPVPIELEEIAGDSKGYYDREAKRIAELQGQTQSETLEAIYTKFNIDHPSDYKAHSLSVSDIVVLHEDGENSAHFVDSFGFTELPKFMLTLEGKENEMQTELAVHIADRYILMHECDDGYDYSILNEQYHLLDGGVYDNPDITIQRAMDMVIADLKEPRFSTVTEQYYRDDYLQGEVYAGSEIEIVDYEELSEKAEQVEQADLEARQAEFRENNPDVVADFRAKTEELFHSLDGQSAEDIEKTVYAYVQSQIDEYGLDAEIVDVVVAGSRCRGIEKENSDLDVVVEYTGSTREDDLFNMLHEDSIYIAGIQVDINPITEGKTGTLETYLPEVETYLQEKAQQEQINNQLVTQGREVVQEQNALASEGKVLSELEKEPVIEPETVHITFTVAECGEIHSMGEFHEGIETVEEAMKLYNAIDPSRIQGIPSIGVNMHIEGTEEWEDEQADIVSGKRIDVDFLNYTPELRDTPKVQDAIKKLIAAYPEKDVIDMEKKEHKIQRLAEELDKLSYDIDTFEYRDSVPDREAQIQMIANDIRSGNVKPLQIFLQTSIDEGIDEDSERQAKELIAKLAEYKPLAKIEELEEQNYNMIDDRLNNGVEKFNREEEKKEQREKPQARSSLKERLAAKQKEVAQGNNKDTKELEKSKNSHREM
jgi:predicted nucleotidyltransferase